MRTSSNLDRVSIRSAALACAVITCGCSWGRFSDLKENTPVVLLNQPGKLSSFGVSLSTLSLAGKASLLVGGAAGTGAAALFALGNGEQPGTDTVDDGYCDADPERPCFLGQSTAAVAHETSPDGVTRDACFAVGIGSTKLGGPGLLMRCQDHFEFTLVVPDSVQTEIVAPALASKDPVSVALASNVEAGVIAVGAASKQLAWAYGPGSLVPVPLPAPAADKSYGERVAVLRVDAGFVFAVSAPSEAHVWLFRADDPSASDPNALPNLTAIGCVGGPPGFGRTLAAGRVDGDANDDLIVADAKTVSVLDGQALAGLPATASTECTPVAGAGSLQATLSCAETSDVTGCSNSDFGAALAVGDLDGDGDGEVVVGAPRMTAADASLAGAVLTYDVEGADKSSLTEARFISSAEDNDELGRALATPLIEGRQIIAAGAPGGGKTALFYCSRLLPAQKRGARCQ